MISTRINPVAPIASAGTLRPRNDAVGGVAADPEPSAVVGAALGDAPAIALDEGDAEMVGESDAPGEPANDGDGD